MGRQATAADRLNATSSDLLFEVGLRETGEPEPCSVQVMLDHQSSLDDDLATPILHDPEADAGHLALVEITRALLHAHKNQTPQTEQRLAQLGPLFDTVLVQFGSSNIKERLSYVVNVFGTSSAIYDTLMGVISQGVREMHRTVADDLRAEGRVAARAEALFGVLSHRAWSIPGALRERILDTSDEHLLQRWFDRAFTARSIEEVFQPLDA